jgi:hypothetical protein
MIPEAFVGVLGSLDFRLITGQSCFYRLGHMRVRQLLLKTVYLWLFADVTPHAIPIGYLPASTAHGNIQ